MTGPQTGPQTGPLTGSLTGRPATRDDVALVTALHRRSDTAWFGAPETDEAETAESLDHVADLRTQSRLLFDGDRLLAAALNFSTEAAILIDPQADVAAVHADLLPWLERQAVEQIDVLAQDTALLAALRARTWVHRYSGYDMRRSYDDWTSREPGWADGITVRDFRPEDADALHHLVYVDARFADEPGHFPREPDNWKHVFLDGRAPDEQPILACRGERIVGAAIGRTFSNGTGWINQLAVAQDERGHGIGTALMAAYFARRRAAGTTAAGLGVMAANRGALRLYESFGLRIVRSYDYYAPPARAPESPSS